MTKEIDMELVLWQKVMLVIAMLPVIVCGILACIGGPLMGLLILLVSGAVTYGCMFMVHTLWWPLQVLSMAVCAVVLFCIVTYFLAKGMSR
jgi:hypothetical protein